MSNSQEYEIPKEMSELLEESVNKYENYRKNIVTKLAYLIGVPDKTLENEEKFVVSELKNLKSNENATIIRHLCILRTQFFKNFNKIRRARENFTQIDELGEYLSKDSINYLRSRNIEVARVSDKITPAVNVAYINQYIQDNIDKVQEIIPDWIKFKYIRALFLMPRGYAGKNGAVLKKDFSKVLNTVVTESKNYTSQFYSYPYQMYIYWPYDFREKDGNILYNDLKFLKLLYGANKDHFTAEKYVIDAKIASKEDIYKFVNEAMNIVVYVDCENVDPYAFAAALRNLDEDNLSKINVINLYDDVNASSAWDYISEIIDIPVEHYDVDRVLENKSLVDLAMALDISKEYYENDIDSAILVSSDSDFWAVIEKLDKVKFYVLNEYKKTSEAVIETLDRHGVPHCYLSDFAQDVIQDFKNEVLYLGLESRVREFNDMGTFMPLVIDELVDELFAEAYIMGEESQLKKEKEVFYNKYLKNGLLIKPVNEEGQLKFKIELKRK
jgi:uncharacterized LabA/DUF88 family protein